VLKLDVVIKLNHRRILDGIFVISGVPAEKVRQVSSSVDKLDKMPWQEVKEEILAKGIAESVADRIGTLVQQRGPISEMLETLKSNSELMGNSDVKAGVDELSVLAQYLKAMNAHDRISLDMSLARGLDYYTGVIYECVASDNKAGVGSCGAGGRYDNLVGVFGKKPIPCVGISFGVDRIFTLLKSQQAADKSLPSRELDVYVMAFGGKEFTGMLLERMSLVSELWDAGIKAEFSSKVKPKLPQQFKAAAEVPLAVILGEDELSQGKVKLKVMGLAEGHPEKDGVLVDRSTIVQAVQAQLSKLQI